MQTIDKILLLSCIKNKPIMTLIKPLSLDVNNKNFLTYRRLWLDTSLKAFSGQMQGVVIDVGGKKENKRGSFLPPANPNGMWYHINIDRHTNPEIFADVLNIPLKSDIADVVLCTEVLEHLVDPKACTNEILRILKKNGIAFISVPFIYPIHADPYDFQRFTADGLRNLLKNFSVIEIYPMGSFPGTIGMLIEIGIPGIQGTHILKKFFRRALSIISRQLYKIDLSSLDTQPDIWKKFTTGYFIRVTK